MTDLILNCTRFETQLSAWLDGELDAFSAAAMERHAAECARNCSVLAADLRSIRGSAAALPSLTPSLDLWSGIEARIAAPVIPIGMGGADSPTIDISSRRVRNRWARPAVAAAALVLVTAGVTHLLETRGGSPTPRAATVATAPVAGQHVTPRDTNITGGRNAALDFGAPALVAPHTVLASAERSAPVPEVYQVMGNLASHNVEASYGGEITRLRAIVDRNRGNLDSATVAVLQHNLQVIDSAIVQCQRALKHDPGSRFLIESLDNALRSKVELLRTTATMSS